MKKSTIIDFLVITAMTALVAVFIYFFQIPSNIPPGSVSGLSQILERVLPFSMGTISLVINVILLVLGFMLIGPEFGAKTVYTTLTLPIFIMVLEKLYPNNESIMKDPVLDIIVAVVGVAICCAVLFKKNASSGGLDIVGKILNKYFRMELGKAVSYAGLVVAATSIFVFDLRTTVLGLLVTYANGPLLDYFIFGLNAKKRVCIVSAEHEDITEFILHKLNAGATLYHATGAYNNKEITEIITVLPKNKYKDLMNYVMTKDPTAFITVYPANEVYTPAHD